MRWKYSEDVGYEEVSRRVRVVGARIWTIEGENYSYSIFQHPPGKTYHVQDNRDVFSEFSERGRYRTLRKAKEACLEDLEKR